MQLKPDTSSATSTRTNGPSGSVRSVLRSSRRNPTPKCHHLSANTSYAVVSVSALGQFMRSFRLTMKHFNETVSLPRPVSNISMASHALLSLYEDCLESVAVCCHCREKVVGDCVCVCVNVCMCMCVCVKKMRSCPCRLRNNKSAC